MSNLLEALGVQRGDRVAIVMPQRFETAIAYMAVFQLGAVAMPLSMLFGPEALEYRLQDSEAVVAVCDESSIANLVSVRGQCPALRIVVGVGEAAAQADLGLEEELAKYGTRLQRGGNQGGRRGGSDLHQRHDRPAQGRLDPASRADRQSARIRMQPELVRLRWQDQRGDQRRFLVAGRLGLDRRLDGCVAADAVFRPAHRGLQRPLQPGAGVHADAGTWRHAHLPVSHRAQGDDEGLSGTGEEIQAQAASHDERRRGRGRRGVQLLPASSWASP